MIRFSCPGCGATYSVDDSKGGKTGKCPKCQTQFQIPMPEGAAAPPAPGTGPAVSLPPPPPVDPNAPVEISPCPGCQARLSVATSDLGADVECPYCKTVYKAKKPGTGLSAVAPSPKRSELDDDRPSRRRRDEEEERPSRRRRRDEEDEDRPSRRRRDEDDEDDRPSRRRDDDEEEEDEDRPVRRRRRAAPRSGAVSTVGVLNYVLGGLCLLCSCFLLLGGAFLKDAFARAQGGRGPGRGQPPIDADLLTTILLVFGVVYVVYAALLIVAGVGVTTRKTYGRALTFVTSGIAILLAVTSLVSAVMNIIAGEPSGICGAFVGVLIFGGYGVFAMITMIKNGDEFS